MRGLAPATIFATCFAASLLSAPVKAFKIDPWSYRPFGVSPRGIESQLETLVRNPRMLLLGPIAFGTRLPAAMGQLKEPAHENLTELSIRCARAPLARGNIAVGVNPVNAAAVNMITLCAGRGGELRSHASDLGEDMEEVIRAVRFNDAPPIKTARALMALVTPSALICGEVRVPENAACWALLMAHAGGLAVADPANPQFARGGNFLYRSHFGDMQFMHAMAARGETLAQSQARVLVWAKFAYQVAGGEIAPEMRIGALSEFAAILGGFEAVSVAEFFEIRGGTSPERIRRIALGALLHTIQDSFAEGHAEREPTGAERFGAISAFRDFTCQSEEKHGAADRAAHYAWFGAAAHEEKSPVTLGAQVLDMLERKLVWDAGIRTNAAQGAAVLAVGEFMRENIFPIVAANAAQVAGAGAQFARGKAPPSRMDPDTGAISAARADDSVPRPNVSECRD